MQAVVCACKLWGHIISKRFCRFKSPVQGSIVHNMAYLLELVLWSLRSKLFSPIGFIVLSFGWSCGNGFSGKGVVTKPQILCDLPQFNSTQQVTWLVRSLMYTTQLFRIVFIGLLFCRKHLQVKRRPKSPSTVSQEKQPERNGEPPSPSWAGFCERQMQYSEFDVRISSLVRQERSVHR